jgi:plasmid stability protein
VLAHREQTMNAITIRRLSDQTFSLIAERAREHGSTIEDEVAAILEQAVGARRPPNWRLETADRIAAMTPKGVVQDDSTLFIRAERDK